VNLKRSHAVKRPVRIAVSVGGVNTISPLPLHWHQGLGGPSILFVPALPGADSQLDCGVIDLGPMQCSQCRSENPSGAKGRRSWAGMTGTNKIPERLERPRPYQGNGRIRCLATPHPGVTTISLEISRWSRFRDGHTYRASA
jgi:hypothetical protein